MAKVGMKRAVGQARRAGEALSALLSAVPMNEVAVRTGYAVTLAKFEQLGNLWECASEENGVTITREANCIHQRMSNLTEDAIVSGSAGDRKDLASDLMLFAEQANRLFAGN